MEEIERADQAVKDGKESKTSEKLTGNLTLPTSVPNLKSLSLSLSVNVYQYN